MPSTTVYGTEPGLSPSLTGPVPQDALTYSRWLAERTAATSPDKSWLVTIGVALCAGVFAIVGSLATAFPAARGILLEDGPDGTTWKRAG